MLHQPSSSTEGRARPLQRAFKRGFTGPAFQTRQLWPVSPLCFLFGSDLLTSEYPEIEPRVSSFSGKLFMTLNSIVPSGLWTKNKTGHQEFVKIFFFFSAANGDAVNAVGILSVRKAS